MTVMPTHIQQMGEPVNAGEFWYSNVLRQCRGEYDWTGSVKAFFVALDLFYWRHVLREIWVLLLFVG